MLEFIVFALLSLNSHDIPTGQNIDVLPNIEILELAKVPEKASNRVAPKLLENTQTAVLAMDLGSGKVLLSERAHRSQPIASISKLMTAMLILENHELDEVVTVPIEATLVNSSTIDVYEYEQFTVGTLVEAILIGSANDAAVTLAIFHSGSEAEFVREMNARAKELKLHSAKFYNSTGLDIIDEEQTEVWGNSMSAYDVLTLARILLQNKFVKTAVAKPYFEGTSVDGKFFHEKATTNKLLSSFLNLKGMKTGFTYFAGECFVALGETKGGDEVLTVILGSQDRFGETKKLISWIYDAFEWR
jgi:serine-type D-Ala-D-Ala carboxypeptidase (penicillin-binding protein 5/6)